MIQPAAATVLDGSLRPPLLGLLISLAFLYALGLLLLLWRYARAHPDTLELRDALRLLAARRPPAEDWCACAA